MSKIKTYSEKLKDPRWQKKRLEILNRDKFRCKRCYDETSTLNVHHLRYEYNKEPWEYDDECLTTLCDECHQYEHDHKEEFGKMLIAALYKKGFLSDELRAIACDVEKCEKLPHHPEVLSTVLGWTFKHYPAFKTLVDDFFDYQEEQQKEKEANNG